MATYFPLDSAAFESYLVSLGFTRGVFHNEVIFERPSVVPNIVVKVYSSSAIGEGSARDVGRDAIRITAILNGKEGKTYPIYKGARVYRTTSQSSIHERTLARIVEAEERCVAWKAEQDAKRPYSPFDRTKWDKISEEDEKYLRGTPVPIVPKSSVKIEEYKGSYVGNIGEELRRTVKVVERKEWENKFLFTMRSYDAVADTFVYWAQEDKLQVGEVYDLRFTIVSHKTFNNLRQNTIASVFGKRVVV